MTEQESEHQHVGGWYCCDEIRQEMAKRIAEDKCVLVDSPGHQNDWAHKWCITHGVPDDPGHAYAKGGLATLD